MNHSTKLIWHMMLKWLYTIRLTDDGKQAIYNTYLIHDVAWDLCKVALIHDGDQAINNAGEWVIYNADLASGLNTILI